MPKITAGTVGKLLVLSLLVGLVLAFFDITPREVLGWGRSFLGDIVGNAMGYAQAAVAYVLLGAVIVVPIWLFGYLWRALKGKE